MNPEAAQQDRERTEEEANQNSPHQSQHWQKAGEEGQSGESNSDAVGSEVAAETAEEADSDMTEIEHSEIGLGQVAADTEQMVADFAVPYNVAADSDSGSAVAVDGGIAVAEPGPGTAV